MKEPVSDFQQFQSFSFIRQEQVQETEGCWKEHLSKTAIRKVSTGATLVKVMANVAVVY